MAITWTVIVFGALLHGMKCNSTPSTSTDSDGSMLSSSTASVESSLTTTQGPQLSTSAASLVSTPTTTLGSAGSSDSTIPTTSLTSAASTTLKSTGSPDTTQPASLKSTGSPDATRHTLLESTSSPDSASPTSVDPNNSSSKLATKGTPQQQNANDSSSLTEHNTTQNPTKNQPITSATLTVSNHSPQNSPTVISSVTQDTTKSSILVTTTHNENGKTPLNQTHPSAVITNSAPYSKPTESIRTTEAQTTPASITSAIQPGPRHLYPATSTSTPGKIIYPPFDLSSSSEGNIVLETCKKLAQKIKGNCLVSLNIEDNELVATIRINADQKIQTESYKPPEPREEVRESSIPDTLVAILASSGALVLILCCFAAYCTYHRRSYRKNQQHLTEELQTVENGYHDNPTLEVMEVVPEMQEKKLALNGEFNDSWIVPIDNLLKDDIPDEEDTHL